MNDEELFIQLLKLLEANQLGKAVRGLENYLLTHQDQQALAKLAAIKEDYQLMVDYWRRGFADEQREEIYAGLVRRTYQQVTNLRIHHRLRSRAALMSIYQRARRQRKDWSVNSLRRDLEGYVSEQALLELEPPHTRSAKEAELQLRHYELRRDLFDYIWTSRSWNDGLTSAFTDILLSPTVDTNDQQLIVSAVTLSLLNAFDANKFCLLCQVYHEADDEPVRQRALVGWALGLDENALPLFPRAAEWVERLMAEEACRKEVAELQMQLLYCMSAEDDTRKVQQEIMPELLKSNSFRVTRDGIEEVEDDPIEDVLHPEEAEQRMERMESGLRKMQDMQKEGADIFFGGFSQMKRFPFFQDICNWMMPFYAEHPGISDIWGKVRGSRFLKTMMGQGSFCDSDKYSFMLAFRQVAERIPDNLLQMLERGEATLAGTELLGEEERQRPAFIRRVYLQGLYRFYRLYPLRADFRNPFDDADCYVVFGKRIVARQPEMKAQRDEVARFFLRRKRLDEAGRVLAAYPEQEQDADYWTLLGDQKLRTGNSWAALEAFRLACQGKPENQRALSGLAKAAFRTSNYQEALEAYTSLLKTNSDRKAWLLGQAICQVNLKQFEEALKTLYKLNYEQPEDDSVRRVLAWTLMSHGKHEQADKLYAGLLAAEKHETEDLLNYGYCLWLQGDVVSAANMFKQYVTARGEAFSAEQEFMSENREFLNEHGVSDTEIWLMIDQL